MPVKAASARGNGKAAARVVVPLRQRPWDIAFIAFFIVNLTVITYVVDVEQLVIDDPNSFEYPVWPPRAAVDVIHWYGRNYDPPLMAREPWWRMTIWLDSLLFGPFYAFAIYAFWRGRDWIRLPSAMWAGVMLANVSIILWEELLGRHATPRRAEVLALNAPWFLSPWLMMARMWCSNHPFTRKAARKSE
eukprot:m51a1_g5533 hypothetical protein (190) ;mRNA; r:454039-454712